jgi:hypothetical protein
VVGRGLKMRWWRLLAVPVAAALIVVGCGVGGGRDGSTKSTAAVVVPPATTTAPARVGGPLVGVISSDNLATELARLDPRTLRPLPGGRLKLPGSWPLLAVAPDRSMAVLGSEAGDLTVVDLVHLRQLGVVKTNLSSAAIFGWAWVGRSRLLLIDTSQQAATEVLAVDLSTRRVVRRQHFNGVVQGYARLPSGLALLVTPANAIGRARLVVSGADAGLRYPWRRAGGRGRPGQPAGHLPSAWAVGVAVPAAGALVGPAGRGQDHLRSFPQRALAGGWPACRDRL